MLKKTIKYTDFNDVEREEDFYFNFSKAELVEMQVSEKEGLDKALETIAASGSGKEIIAAFKRIVLMAYGEKSEDGRRFVKNEAIRTGFEQTEAYSQLFMELATDADAGSAFVNGIIPKDLDSEIAKIEAKRTTSE